MFIWSPKSMFWWIYGFGWIAKSCGSETTMNCKPYKVCVKQNFEWHPSIDEAALPPLEALALVVSYSSFCCTQLVIGFKFQWFLFSPLSQLLTNQWLALEYLLFKIAFGFAWFNYYFIDLYFQDRTLLSQSCQPKRCKAVSILISFLRRI